jgi:hypothetical protein
MFITRVKDTCDKLFNGVNDNATAINAESAKISEPLTGLANLATH